MGAEPLFWTLAIGVDTVWITQKVASMSAVDEVRRVFEEREEWTGVEQPVGLLAARGGSPPAQAECCR